MAHRPIIYADTKIDSFTRNVRAVCGALLGVVVFALVCLHWGPFSTRADVLGLLGSVIVCVVGAVRFGDPFWVAFLTLFRFG